MATTRWPSASGAKTALPLAAVGTQEGDGMPHEPRRGLELPQLPAGALVDGLEPSVEGAVEHQPAPGSQHAAAHRERLPNLPGDASGGGIPRDRSEEHTSELQSHSF